MTEQVAQLAGETFATLWNGAGSFDEAVEQIRGVVGKTPRWAVLARASALRRQGVGLKQHEVRGREK
jgi:hypothetical protein